ncbi:MAG: flavin reductase family protein [Pelagimonas sp.]|jgi:flavin reductase (DIM6/NTAB) family NADH-FMN oxidoreductase RutF|nr:flavin reductase family protein [Pelagimonas sp.]
MSSNTHSFDPNTSDSRLFRAALGQFATGVTVVTCPSESGPLGFTANSFASVSLDPPLVLWSPARSSDRHAAFVNAKHYAIHILGQAQEKLCSGFARQADAFDLCDWSYSPQGVPLLSECLTRFECTQVAVHEGGDHSIIIGRVDLATVQAQEPLLFQGGKLGRFDAL